MALSNQDIKDGIIFRKLVQDGSAATWGLYIKDSVRDAFKTAEVEIEITRNDDWSYCEDRVKKGLRFCKDSQNRFGVCNEYAKELLPYGNKSGEHKHTVNLMAECDDNPNNNGVALKRWSMDNGKTEFSSSFASDQLPRGKEDDDMDLGRNVTFYPFVNLNGVSGPGENEGNEFNYQEYPKGRDDRKKPSRGSGKKFSAPGEIKLSDETAKFPKTLEFYDSGGDDANCTMYLRDPDLKIKKETSLTKLKIGTVSGTYKGKDIENNKSVIISRTIDTAVNFYALQFEGNNGKNNGMPEKLTDLYPDEKHLFMYDSCAELGEKGTANVEIKIKKISSIDRGNDDPPPVVVEPEPDPDPEPEPTPKCLKKLTIDFPDGNEFLADAGSAGISVKAIAKGVHTDGCLWTWTELGGDQVASDYAANVQTLDFPTTCGQNKIYTVRADWVDEVCTLDYTANVTLSSRSCPAPNPLCEKTLDITVDKPRTVGNPGDTVVVKALADGVNTDGCVWTWTEVGGDVLASGGGENQQTLPMPSACGQERVWNVTADFDDTGTDPPGACVLTATVQVRTLTESCPPPEPPPPPDPVIVPVYVGGPCPTSANWSNGFPDGYTPNCPAGPTADRTEESLGGLILKTNPRNKQKLILSFASLDGVFNPLRQQLALGERDEDKSLANKLLTIKVEWKRSANWEQRFRAIASCSDIKEGSTLQAGGAPYSRPGIDYSTAASSSPSDAYDRDYIIYNIDGNSVVEFHHTSTPPAAPTRFYYTGENITFVDSAPDETQDPPVITRTYTTTCEPAGGVTETYSPWPPCTPEVFVTKSGGATAEAVYSDGAPDGPNGDQSIKITLLSIRESVTDHSMNEIGIEEELVRKVWVQDPSSAFGVPNVDTNGSSRAGTDVNYGVAGVALDVSYFSNTGYKRPVVIGVHGGAFRGGDKDGFDNDKMKGTYFTNLGYNYVSVNYRLATNANLEAAATGANVTLGSIDFTQPAWSNASRLKIDDQLSDLAKAVKWVIDNADTYNFDVSNIALFGHSAGAHLVAALGARSSILQAEGVDVNIIRGVIVMDTDGFDIVETIGGAYNSGTVSNSKNDWMFMNVYGVHPSIPGASGLDFANLAAANAALSSQSILDNLQSVSKGFEDFAQSFCVVVRGTAAKRADNVEFLEAAEDKGIGTRLLDYGPGSITDGVFTYDHEGIQDVLGATDISNDNQDLLDLGLNNVSTEISGYLRSVFRPAPAGSSPSTLRNMGGINGLSLADYHEHSQKIRFRNPASGTSITGLASGGTKISEFIGVVGALLPDTIDQNVSAAESLGMDFPLNLIG